MAFATQGQAGLVDFEELSLASNSFYNGGPNTNEDGWSSASDSLGAVHFGNSYNSNFGGFWNGFSYSNVVDSVTPGFGNQYASFPGHGSGGSTNYAIGYAGSNAFINLLPHQRFDSVQVSNTTYAGLSMLHGDAFAKKFGGEFGNDPDFFSVVFTGFDALDGLGNTVGSIEFFLADYRFDDNDLDYVVDSWQIVALSALGNARSLRFSFRSSDVGGFGINTPTYLSLDHLRIASVPEPSSYVLILAILLGLRVRNRQV